MASKPNKKENKLPKQIKNQGQAPAPKREATMLCESFQVMKVTLVDPEGKVGINYYTQFSIPIPRAQQILGEIMMQAARKQGADDAKRDKTIVKKGG